MKNVFLEKCGKKKKKRHRNIIRVRRTFSIPSISYYVRSTSYLETCLSSSLYSYDLANRTGYEKDRRRKKALHQVRRLTQ
jgi:hypothetical protein